MATKQINISVSLDRHSLDLIDSLRGKNSRSAFIRLLVNKFSASSYSEEELVILLDEFNRKTLENHTKILTLLQDYKNE